MITTATPLRSKEEPAANVSRSAAVRDHISWSQISTFRGCPRKYQFLYIERARPDFLPTALHFGGAIHGAIEHLFRARMEGCDVTQPDLFDVFMTRWSERRPGHEDVPLRFNQREDPGTLFDLAGRMLTSFLASPASRLEGEIVAVEEELRLPLLPGVPDVLCRVDLIWRDDLSMHLADFKTSRGRWNQEKADASAEQLLLYEHMANAMARDLALPTKLRFIVVTKHRSPIVETFHVSADAGRLQQIRDTFSAVWKGIAAGNFYPNPSPQNCSTCPFKSRCPAFAGK